MFGALIAEFMDAENTMWGTSAKALMRVSAPARRSGKMA